MLEQFESPWWTEKTKTKVLPKIDSLVKQYYDLDRARLRAYQNYSNLYLNRNITDNDLMRSYTNVFQAQGRNPNSSSEYSRVPLNVAKIFTDAVHARVTRPAIGVEFLSAGGNYTLRKKCMQATQFFNHQMHSSDLMLRDSEAVLDALVYGLGVIKTCPHPKIGRILNSRVHPRDIFVDQVEVSASGNPTHIYQRQFVSRSKLAALYPSKAAKINAAARLTESNDEGFRWRSDSDGQSVYGMIEVFEGWKKPSYPGAGDGKHIIFIDGEVLEYDEWAHEDFPFSFVYWKRDPSLGFFGISLVEELIGIHSDINTSIMHTEKTIEVNPKPYMLLPEDAGVNEAELKNLHGLIIRFSGRAPQVVLPKSVPLDIVQYIEGQWQRGLQIAKLVALGMPENTGARAETGAAMTSIADIQSTELAPAFKERERFLIRLAEQQLIAGKALDARMRKNGEGGFKVVARKDRNTVMDIDWKSFDLDPKHDSYVVQAQPTSALSVTFGGRLGEVERMIQSGMIEPNKGAKLLDIPDLDQERRLANADLDFVDRVMEEILDEGKYTEPEPTMDLNVALKESKRWLYLARNIGAEEERLVLVDRFIRSVLDLIQKQQDATRMQAAGMSPGAVGGPPSVGIAGGIPGVGGMQPPM